MKQFLLIILLFVSILDWAQDTLLFNTKREGADFVFGQLNSVTYDYALLNRSLTDNSVTLDQIKNNYNHIHDANVWGAIYSDVVQSYVDTSMVVSTNSMAEKISNFFYFVDLEMGDELIQPFGLILQNLSYIDSAKNFDGSLVV